MPYSNSKVFYIALTLLADEQSGIIRTTTYEIFFFIGLFDMDSISDELFAELMQCYIIIAAIKAIYFSNYNNLS